MSGRILGVALAGLFALPGCRAPREVVATGEISFYADSLAGERTASGARYDPGSQTCAHRELPFGTKVYIERLDTGATATCVVNDRGPYAKDRILDVSKAVAESLDLVEAGATEARLSVDAQD